jgi:hypothetical protein
LQRKIIRNFAENDMTLACRLSPTQPIATFSSMMSFTDQEQPMQTSRCTFLFVLAFTFLTVPLVSNAQGPLQFIPITPCRLVDTRYSGGGPIMGGTSQNFAIQGSQGKCQSIPISATAYSLNVTVVPDGFLGYITVWPAGQNQPLVSTMNSYDGRVKANAAIVGAGNIDNGAVSVYATNTTNLLLDLDGYFEPIPTNDPVLAFYPLTPCRVLDTRTGGKYLHGGQQYGYQITDICNVPTSAAAYSLNFTAIPHEPLGYLTVWPAGQEQPVTSLLNAPTGTITANAGIIPAGMQGQNNIDVYALDDTDLLIDVNGYFALPNSGPGGLSLFTLTPCRALDTRPNDFSGTLPVNVVGSRCAPIDNLPSLAQAMVVNATVIPDGFFGYLTLWPNGQPQPVVSTLNAYDGALTSNMAVVPMTNGFVNAYASNSTNLLVDLFDYFAIPSGLNGNYTFTINGNNTSTGNMPPSASPCQGTPQGTVGPLMMAGSFVADGNGNVTGVLDLNCSNLPPNTSPPTNVSFKGTYSIQPNGLGTMTITPTLNAPFDLSVAISSTGNGRLTLQNESSNCGGIMGGGCYLPSAWGAGAINVQNPADLQQYPAGNFASGFSGVDPTLNRYAGAGAYQIGQSQLVVSNDAFFIDNGTEKPLLVRGSLISLDPNTGRGVAPLIVNGASTHWIYYVTSANQLTFLSIDPISSPANLVLQTMLMQSTSAFDDTYLNGGSVIRTSGLAQSSKNKQRRLQGGGTTDVVLGLFTGDGKGGYTASLDENNGGTLTQQQTSQGTYAVNPDGLVTFNNLQPLPLLYLVNKNEAFELGSVLGSMDGQDLSVSSGFLAPQTGAPFSTASATGTYWGGNYMPVTMEVTDSVTTAFADGMGNLTGTNVTSNSMGIGGGNFSGTYSVDGTGRMTLTESGSLSAILYVISPTRVALLPANDPNPSVAVLGSTN